MNRWRGTWAAAQITGAIFSSLVWIVECGLSFPALVVTAAIGIALVIARNTPPMLWWRFGARPANDFQRDTMLTAIVPIASLRGRHQPSVWIGRRLAGTQAVMPSPADLVVSPEFVSQVVSGQLANRHASVVVSHALGQSLVHDSTLVNSVDAYCLPWRVVQVLTGVAGKVARRNPIIGFSWKIRWIVFGVAAIDSCFNGRWVALMGVILIAILSWSTGHFQNTWLRTLHDLGAERADSEGLGPDPPRSLATATGRPYHCEPHNRPLRITPAGQPEVATVRPAGYPRQADSCRRHLDPSRHGQARSRPDRTLPLVDKPCHWLTLE
jgi:hypothetical protein